MSLVSDLRKLVVNAKKLVAELPASVEKRRLEQAFDKVDVALSKMSDDATMPEVKEAVANVVAENTEEDLVPLGSTTPFSDEDIDKIYAGEQPDGE